jgi:hypothetical protein
MLAAGPVIEELDRSSKKKTGGSTIASAESLPQGKSERKHSS